MPSTRGQSPTGDPDADLIAGLRAGDEAAFATLMERRLSSVHRLAYRLLGDRYEAEDIAQESFLKFWKAAPTWREGEARILTWLCRVATNACYDRLRKSKPELPGEDLDPADDRASAEDHMMRDQRWDALQGAMMTLPERQRAALSLYYDEGLSQKDAADIMSLSVKAYEALLVRGRRALKTMMTEVDHV